MISEVWLLKSRMRISLILLDHLLDVVVVVENDSANLGEGQGTIDPQILEGSGRDKKQPPDFVRLKPFPDWSGLSLRQ